MPRDAPSTPHHQRAHGCAALVVDSDSRLRHLHQSAPLRWLFPAGEGDEPRAGALVNIAGGLAGGDRIEARLDLLAGARFTAATAAAEKIYRSLGAETEIRNALRIGGDAVCEWLPQETILFDGARLRRRLDVALDGEASLLAVECVVFGRAAHGERFRRGALLDGWRIRRDGRLVWADAIRLDDPATELAGRFTLGGGNAAATLLLAAPDAARHRDRLREASDGGASLVSPGLLLARWLGEAAAVRAGVAAALMALRAAAFGHPPRLPRLWRT
jgi:urease accessory protein